MNLDDLTIGQVRQLTSMLGRQTNQSQSHSFVVGKCYFIRTISYHYTGRLIAITDTDLVLEDVAWIADSGRFADALKTGNLLEVEPYPDQVIIGRSGIVDASAWSHKLPREQK